MSSSQGLPYTHADLRDFERIRQEMEGAVATLTCLVCDGLIDGDPLGTALYFVTCRLEHNFEELNAKLSPLLRAILASKNPEQAESLPPLGGCAGPAAQGVSS